MKKKQLAGSIALASVLVMAGCGKEPEVVTQPETNEPAQEQGADVTPEQEEFLIDEAALAEIFEKNTFAYLTEKNGRVSYTQQLYYADGTQETWTFYQDPDRYVFTTPDERIIIEDDDVYGYNYLLDAPTRYLFVDGYEDFVANKRLPAIALASPEETVTDCEESEGTVRVTTETRSQDGFDVLPLFGYSKQDSDTLITEYVIDTGTEEILELTSYFMKDDEKVRIGSYELEPECDVYVPEPEITDVVFSDDTRTVTVIADAGTEEERIFTQTAGKGCAVGIWTGDAYEDMVYTDPECLYAAEEGKLYEDTTSYCKRVVDYSAAENWAYYAEGTNKDVDLFLICPTVDMNDEYNMSMDDTETKESFYGALNMERGIYEEDTRMFAPYYRQGAMKIYGLSPEDREPYLNYAYCDVAAAFEYYLANENDGRPIILAGFSQGADLCYRLLADYFGYEDLQEQLVAVYAIGWPCTEELVQEYPQIVPATGADDTGVVVSFDCEAPELTETFITPAGTQAYTINPLNWKTDSTPAEASENLGACFTDYSGGIALDAGALCGCYIDESRGILKVTDVAPADFPAYVPGLPEGAYHIYDYQFFYRNLQENVGVRINAFLN